MAAVAVCRRTRGRLATSAIVGACVAIAASFAAYAVRKRVAERVGAAAPD
jgi:hypothetical protein